MSIKFTELPLLAGVDIADDDILAIVDVSEGVSKRVTRADLAKLQSGRNLIINGSGRINQRSYVSGAATAGANQFTLDRWFVVTSGQSLTFTGTDAGRVMTAPAGGAEQVIEGANIVGGTYVINWTGTATCTVGGVARAKGDTFTLTTNANVTVKFTGGTFSEVQVEIGGIATPFERLSIERELGNCEPYFEIGQCAITTYTTAGNGFGYAFTFRSSKARVPTITFVGTSYFNASGLSTTESSTHSIRVQAAAAATGPCLFNALYHADAELIA
jgi:hypothetical protein